MLTAEEEEQFGDVFPFRQIMCPGSACASHAELDGFTARANDPVWQSITPPNGPSPCYCTVLSLLEEDVAAEDTARTPGLGRIDAELLKRCASFT